jgi:hypothetical protein
VADQHIAGEAKPASDGLDIISHRGKIVSFIGRNRRAPAALIESDTARLSSEAKPFFRAQLKQWFFLWQGRKCFVFQWGLNDPLSATIKRLRESPVKSGLTARPEAVVWPQGVAPKVASNLPRQAESFNLIDERP